MNAMDKKQADVLQSVKLKETSPLLPRRLQSIDVFRAITMFFMIFVNDVDGVTKIPRWIKHVDGFTDGLGFADTIFPAFLFIVGLSIPFALNKRIQSNESRSTIVWHIALRSFALIVMGFFHVNLENYNKAAALLREPVFEILLTLAFFLIWLDYKPTFNKTTRNILQATGVLILVGLSIVYKGGRHGEVIWLRPYWWGILGLIGWGYLTCSLVYLFSKGNLKILIPALIFFLAYTTINQTYILEPFRDFLKYFGLLNSGSEVSLIMSGVIISLIYKSLNNNKRRFFIRMALASIVMPVFGFLIRPFGGISKIQATPSWVGICIGISIAVFTILIFLVDVKGKANRFNVIRPAGTSTLTCYLIPYFLYSFMGLFHIRYPDILNEGIGGILRSFAVAFIVIFITGFLEKKNLRLKI
jgi:predicted acyltransferase